MGVTVPQDPLAGFKGLTSERKDRRKERGKGRGEGDGVDIAGPTFSLVYATLLLQHEAQFGLNPALIISRPIGGILE